MSFELYWVWLVATGLDSQVRSPALEAWSGGRHGHPRGAWERMLAAGSCSRPATQTLHFGKLPGALVCPMQMTFKGPQSLPFTTPWFSKEESEPRIGKEQQGPGLQLEGTGLDTFPTGWV